MNGKNSLLLMSAENGDLNGLIHALDNDEDIETRDANGQTPLLLAAEKGHFGIVRELLHRNASVNARDEDGWTALIASCKEGYPDIVASLLDNGAKHNMADTGGWTPLVWASYKGHSQVVRELLRYGADPNERGQHNMTALIWAAGRGHTNVVRELLESGARAEISDKYGTTALIWACRKGHYDVSKLLIIKGADVNSVGTHGWTPLIMAAKGGFADVVSLILENRANVNLVDQDGRSALTWAAKGGHEATVRALLNHGVYLNMPDKHGDTPLILAAKEGHSAVIKALLAKYADCELTDSDGKTALYQAVEKGHVDCVRELLAAGANTEITNKEGETPLIRGARKKHTLCVKLLLEKGANPAASDKKGDTALHISVRSRYSGLCEVLLRDQKNSRLLYKPNKAGDTPYSIDRAHKQSVLSPIFGNRDLSADINRMELPSGQDTFVMALADFVSDPSLSTPLTVGLYSRWGTGKSIILQRIYEQLKAYSFQEATVLFRITAGVVWAAACLTITIGLVTWALSTWVEALLTALATFVVLMGLIILGRSSNRTHGGNMNKCGLKLLQLFERAILFVKLLFCVPPSVESIRAMLPVHFIFVDLSKNSIFGDNPLTSLVNLAQELNDAIERDYGTFVTRLYRVFRSGPYRARRISHLNLRARWKTSCCCVPSVIFSAIVLIALWVGLFCLAIFKNNTDKTIFGIEIGSACVIGVAFVWNIPRFFVVIYCLVLSMKKRIMIVSSQPGIRDETFMHVLKQEIDLQADMLECLDGFTRRQTRVVLFIDLLESLEQQKVLHFVNSVNALLSEAGHPFVSLVSVDPRLLLKAIDQNLQMLQDSHISPYDYFKNTVDLPCYFSDQTKQPLTGFLPKEISSALTDINLQENPDQFEANHDLEWDAGIIAEDEDDDVDSLRAGCNGKVPLIENRPSTARRMSNDSSNYSDDNHDREMTHNGNANYDDKDNVSTDLSKFLHDNDSGSLADIKRIMNIVSLTGRLLHARNIPFRWRTLASWISLADAWPYKISWLIILGEDTSLSLQPELSLRKLYSIAGPFMPVLGDPELSLDADMVYFETYLSNRHPLLTIGDMSMFLPCTFHVDPSIRKSMTDYLQAVRSGTISKVQVAGSVSEATVQHITSPSSSNRFMWRSIAEDAVLSQMTSDDVVKQLSEIDGINSDSVALYQMQLKDHNISGKVLAACDLNELRDAMQMAFGDWQLFKSWIVAARTREQTISPRTTIVPMSFQSHSQADSTVGGSRTDSTSEIPNSPGTSRGFRGVSSGSEHASGMQQDPFDEPIPETASRVTQKGPYGSHTVRPVLSRSQTTPSRQIKQDSMDSEKSSKFTKGPIIDDIIEGRKDDNFNSHIRYLNHLQRSADSGFASTEVEAQQQAKLKPLMRQTSVQENKEYEVEMAELCNSKTGGKYEMNYRELNDEAVRGTSRKQFRDDISFRDPIPEIKVQSNYSLKEGDVTDSGLRRNPTVLPGDFREQLNEVVTTISQKHWEQQDLAQPRETSQRIRSTEDIGQRLTDQYAMQNANKEEAGTELMRSIKMDLTSASASSRFHGHAVAYPSPLAQLRRSGSGRNSGTKTEQRASVDSFSDIPLPPPSMLSEKPGSHHSTPSPPLPTPPPEMLTDSEETSFTLPAPGSQTSRDTKSRTDAINLRENRQSMHDFSERSPSPMDTAGTKVRKPLISRIPSVGTSNSPVKNANVGNVKTNIENSSQNRSVKTKHPAVSKIPPNPATYGKGSGQYRGQDDRGVKDNRTQQYSQR